MKFSTLRTKYLKFKGFYDDKGNVYLCKCGNMADMITFDGEYISCCCDCLIPFGQEELKDEKGVKREIN